METQNVAVVRNDGVVQNVILAGLGFTLSDRTMVPTDGQPVGPGWTYADGAFTPPVPLPPPVVQSVLPVAFRRALRATPAPEGSGATNARDYVLAALEQPGYEDAREALEYAVRIERQDALDLGAPLGFTEAQIDAVLTLAATYPGSDAVLAP